MQRHAQGLQQIDPDPVEIGAQRRGRHNGGQQADGGADDEQAPSARALAGESDIAHARSQGLTVTVLAPLPDSVT